MRGGAVGTNAIDGSSLTAPERFFDDRRQRFLASMRLFLVEPGVDNAAKQRAIDDTINAIRQMGVALGVTDA